ncbi:hypothetical protein [Streptomyces huiliensis]|uniref:hypothetical protein n=1 Tax=Streptomyces huiliensis TaxID=2876027 RepID=UPI0027E170E8|nr:hypothetical protein [Streptomyces huiliensis]
MSADDWDAQLGINTGQAAYLNANVRYHNVGNAPVYNVSPSTPMVISAESAPAEAPADLGEGQNALALGIADGVPVLKVEGTEIPHLIPVVDASGNVLATYKVEPAQQS